MGKRNKKKIIHHICGPVKMLTGQVKICHWKKNCYC